MNEKERLEMIKHSYSLLEGLVRRINERVIDAKEGVKEENQNLIMGSLEGLDETADRLKNVFTVMKYIHQGR